jgi:two-component system, repressor protein LuxO
MVYRDARTKVTAARVLLVEADAGLKNRMGQACEGLGLPVHLDVASHIEVALSCLRGSAYDAVVASLEIDSRIIALLRPYAPNVLLALSGTGSVAAMVEAMRQGADDVVSKPFTAEALVRRLHARLSMPQTEAEGVPPHTSNENAIMLKDFEGFIGRSAVMRGIYGQIARVAPSRASVFLTGESGTGKEVCAEAIHRRSGRSGRCVALNCGAIPRDLMEAAIFGHIRGAFTGAAEDRAGAAEQADGGTLFLDEIGEMDLGLQAKLLRLIQSGEVQRLGDTRPRRVDVRFVCATNRNPQAEVAAGRFREDLFYRLHVLPVHLPPLRERGDDVLELAQSFLLRFSQEEGRDFAGFDPLAEKIIATYSWPGNVRQLQNVIRRMVVLNDGGRVTADMLPPELSRDVLPVPCAPSRARKTEATAIMPLWKHEQQIIEQALAAFGGNTARAAAALQISPSTIYRKRLEWNAQANA